jgi:hypothetical protein
MKRTVLEVKEYGFRTSGRAGNVSGYDLATLAARMYVHSHELTEENARRVLERAYSFIAMAGDVVANPPPVLQTEVSGHSSEGKRGMMTSDSMKSALYG